MISPEARVFGPVERRIFKRNVIKNVICQIRFPPILKIESDIPTEFQDRIRTYFPNYERKVEYGIDLSSNIENMNSVMLIKKLNKQTANINHEFSTIDGNCKINMGKTFIAISMIKYPRWEEFKEAFLRPLTLFIEFYNPMIFTRIGLRYIDVIDRKELNLEEIPWIELINHHVLGLIGSDKYERLNSFNTNQEICLENNSFVRIMTTCAINDKSQDSCLLIDSDFYCNANVAIQEYDNYLEYLHNESTGYIHWVMKDLLKKSLNKE